ncbi:MAG: EamA family transporter [Candidatus Acidiferrales bacterium]
MGIVLGLTGALCWGIADFSARFSSRRVGAYRTLFFMQFFGFIALSAYLKWTGAFGAAGIASGWRPWALAVVAGLLNMAASLSLYHSFEVGVMSIVAPVSSSYPALTVALALASGERIGLVRGAGLAVTLAGVILAAISFARRGEESGVRGGATADDAAARAPRGDAIHTHVAPQAAVPAGLAKGVVWAIAAALGFGVLFWMLGFYVVPAVGAGVSVWVMRLTAIATLFLFSFPARQTVRMPRGSVWWLLAAIGLMDTAAFVINNAALHIGPVSVVSVLASLYGAVTVVLAWIFLRERLEWTQWCGIALIFCGIVLVSI